MCTSSPPVWPSPAQLADVTARLRAGGCVFAEDEARLLIDDAATAADLAAMVARRSAGEPLEQVLGWADFCGLRIIVEPGVFVPRRRTEFLVTQAAALAPPNAVIVDLCCGTAAVATALAAALDFSELHAADIDPAAVHCAEHNIDGAGQVHCGDLYEALPDTLRGRVDLLVANVPYVPTDSFAFLPVEARLHEPRAALDGGPDGLDIARRLAAGANHWLTPTGKLLFEVHEAQAATAADILTASGLHPEVATSAASPATVVIGTPTPPDS